MLSTLSFKCYLVLLADFSYFCSPFPLLQKSEVHHHVVEFVAYVHTQFGVTPKSFQADNSTKFINNATTSFLCCLGISLHLSCPHTSPQNGKAECMLCTINNMLCTLLLHEYMPPIYWAEALATTNFMLNRRPSSSVKHSIH